MTQFTPHFLAHNGSNKPQRALPPFAAEEACLFFFVRSQIAELWQSAHLGGRHQQAAPPGVAASCTRVLRWWQRQQGLQQRCRRGWRGGGSGGLLAAADRSRLNCTKTACNSQPDAGNAG